MSAIGAINSLIIEEILGAIESSCHTDAPLTNVKQRVSILEGSVFANNIPCLALSSSQAG